MGDHVSVCGNRLVPGLSIHIFHWEMCVEETRILPSGHIQLRLSYVEPGPVPLSVLLTARPDEKLSDCPPLAPLSEEEKRERRCW